MRDTGPWRAWAIWAVLGIVVFRLALGLMDATELSTDEAQYWLWGRSFEWGYFSKPPLIGWIIGSFSGDSAVSVRLPAALIHGATSLVVLVLAGRLVAPRAAAFAAVSYALMPAVTLGSALMTTDTPLMLFIALGYLAQHWLAARASGFGAVLLGLAIGLGILAKYAMLYAVAGMALAALVDPVWRISRRDTAIAAAVSVALILPHLAWISGHGFVTFEHVASDAEWQGFVLHPQIMARFLAEQLAVFGPVLLLAWAFGWLTRPGPGLRGLYAGSALILAVVAGQALMGRALANWGVGFTVGGVIVAAHALRGHKWAMIASLVIGGLVAVALPAAKVWAVSVTMPDGRLALHRYLGHFTVADRAFSFAQAKGARTIIADDRDLLADLSLFARDDLQVRANPNPQFKRHHWDLELPLRKNDLVGPIVLLTRSAVPPCDPLAQDQWPAGPGFAQGSTLSLFVLAPGCFAGLAE